MQEHESAAQQPSIKIDQNSKGEAIVSVRVTPEPQPEDTVTAEKHGIGKMPRNAVDLWLETCALLEIKGAHVAGDPQNRLEAAYIREIRGETEAYRDESQSSEG